MTGPRNPATRTRTTRSRVTARAVLVAGVLLSGTSCTGGADTPPAADAGSTASTPAPTSVASQNGDPFPPSPGSQVVRRDHRTQHQGEPIDKHALVYLPPGCDQQDTTRRYDTTHLIHGAGGSADSLLGGPGQSSTLADLPDDLIGDKGIPPTTAPTPMSHPGGITSTDRHYTGELDRVLPRELENDRMPGVESTLHNQAQTGDAADFRASGDHRAFSSLSRGGVTTWYTFIDGLDHVRYFAPTAGDSWVIQDSGGASAPEQTAARLDQAAQDSCCGKDEHLVVGSVGSRNGTRYQLEPQTCAMRELSQNGDSGDDRNLRCVLDDGGGRDMDSLHAQFSSSSRLFFHS